MAIRAEICNELSDIEIVKKSLDDIDFFSCLYDRYEQKFLRYIKRITVVKQDEAEDILQEAFIKIWRNLNDFDQSLKLSSWLYRIVHNETISYWRKKKSFGKDRQVSLEDDHFESIPYESEEVDEELKEMFTHSVLELMPLKYKTVLVLKFLEGMSYDEISDVLKIPEGTVATRINRAKKSFIQMTKKENISLFE
ncbi:MAG: hypothetical protein DRQ97_13285 [Gammaproteobacteria bacterium]|nr:MAG: hypothetical protein DRQ97_13285 [Gammaproteobacteria bacterium]